MSAQTNYQIIGSNDQQPLDTDLENLLKQVYVAEGFTRPEVAETMFAASAVKERGNLFLAIILETQRLIGSVIVVPPTSRSHKLGGPTDAELHLLAVHPEYRGIGVGRSLVERAMQNARDSEFDRMILWSQPEMTVAHRLYLSKGFVRKPGRDFCRDGQEFWVFEADFMTSPS